MLKSYLDLKLEVIKKANFPRYANGNDIRLVHLGHIALLCNFILTTSSGKHLEDMRHAHIVFLKYKIKTSAKDTDTLSIGFDLDCGRRRDELNNNKNIKGKNHIRIMIKSAFGFAEHQKKLLMASVIN